MIPERRLFMAIGGVSYSYPYNYNYSYNSNGLSSSSWTDKANQETDKLKDSLGLNNTDKTSSTSSTGKASTAVTASSTNSFLMGYQMALEDLESASQKLMADGKNNVFSKLDSAWKDVANGKGTVDGLNKALNDVVSAVKSFADEYNYTVSYLKKNVGQGSGISDQLQSLQRGLPSEKTLKAMGMSIDTNGNLQVDENKLKEALVSTAGSYVDDKGKIQNAITFDKSGNMSIDPNGALSADEKGNLSVDWSKQGSQSLSQGSDMVKELIGGQYGMADRVGRKATSILDSSVDKILGSDNSSNVSDTEKTDSSSSSNKTTYGTSKGSSMMSDSFMQFASFAKSGAFNLSNYYAVSMLNILV